MLAIGSGDLYVLFLSLYSTLQSAPKQAGGLTAGIRCNPITPTAQVMDRPRVRLQQRGMK